MTLLLVINKVPRFVAACGSALVVVASLTAVSLTGWPVLARPAQFLRPLGRGGCSLTNALDATSRAIPTCPIELQLRAVLPEAIVLLLALAVAKLLARGVARAWPQLPGRARFLAAPTQAVISFELVWAGLNYDRPTEFAPFPQIVFPAVIGIFVALTIHYKPRLQTRMKAMLAVRGRLPKVFLRSATIGLSLMLTWLALRPQLPLWSAVREQVLVLLCMSIAYLLLTPQTSASSSARIGLTAGLQTAGERADAS